MLDMFNAKSIAVIGASETKGKIGYDIMKSLLNYYKGKIVPVNPRGGKIHGLPAYTSIKEHGPVDLAVITIPSHIIPATVEECGETGIKNIVVISAGFKEVDEEGAKLENQVVEICKQYDIKLVGPNCLGIMNTYNDMNASFSSDIAHKGKISFMTQSGAIMAAILDYADKKNIGFSRIVSLGNKAMINENACINDFLEDENTEVISAFVAGAVTGGLLVIVALIQSLVVMGLGGAIFYGLAGFVAGAVTGGLLVIVALVQSLIVMGLGGAIGGLLRGKG
ncbi:MAG: CoA-binding protein [Methanobacterium paludis]|nr:CoA-binding protein [Methanobacterium paludis]